MFTKLDCDSIVYTVKISRFISASAASDKKFICLGDTVNFYSNDTGIDPLQFEWIFGEGDTSNIKILHLSLQNRVNTLLST